MNVVEAIDAWIDGRLGEVDDRELTEMLQVQDAIAASEASVASKL